MNDLFEEFEYAIAPGWDADPEDMVLMHDLLGQPPVTQPPDEYPVRTSTLDGQEWGDGRIDHALDFLDFIPVTKIAVIEEQFHEDGALVSAPVTLAVRMHQREAYIRYNCYSILPQAQADYTVLDYMVEGEIVATLRWRFQRLRRIIEAEP